MKYYILHSLIQKEPQMKKVFILIMTLVFSLSSLAFANPPIIMVEKGDSVKTFSPDPICPNTDKPMKALVNDWNEFVPKVMDDIDDAAKAYKACADAQPDKSKAKAYALVSICNLILSDAFLMLRIGKYQDAAQFFNFVAVKAEDINQINDSYSIVVARMKLLGERGVEASSAMQQQR